MNEAETRAELIDPALKTPCWGMIKVFAEELTGEGVER